MEFRGHSNQTVPAQPGSTEGPSGGYHPGRRSGRFAGRPFGRLLQIASVLLLFAVTGLVISLTFLLGTNNNIQQRSVMKTKYQAVFLNNGQVYFGNIASISSQTLDLRNIYYLQTSASSTSTTTPTTNSSSNVSLVKLGCELHAPYDQMLINDTQVIFWENIQDSSQVVKAIASYKKSNTAQTCSQQSQSSTDQAPSAVSPTAATPTTTTPATTNKK